MRFPIEESKYSRSSRRDTLAQMHPRLLIKLPAGWRDVSQDVGEAGAMFVREGSEDVAALQVSYGLKGPESQHIDEEQLVEMARQALDGTGMGWVIHSYGGPSLFGSMGTAIYEGGKYQRVQVWFLSNGRDLIMATHMSLQDLADADAEEVEGIVTNLALLPA